MVDREDDSFQEFINRANERQKKLESYEQKMATKSNPQQSSDVTYPPLSPVLEETTSSSRKQQQKYRYVEDEEGEDEEEDTTYRDGEENDTSVSLQENVHSSRPRLNLKASDLNYSSDLSLDLEPEDPVYRAEPVVCESSSEEALQQQPVASSSLYSSARKVPCLSIASCESPAPLQERQTEQKTSSQSLPESNLNDELLWELRLQVEQAEQTRTQLKKVVEISKYGSEEHVEAARRLQIADLKHLNLCNQMALFRQGIRKKTESLGSIKVTGIRLKMTAKLRNDLADSGFTHYFFCVGSCSSQIKNTELVSTSVILKQALKTYVEFREPLVFTDLPSDFVIKLEVFELITGQGLPKFLSRLTPSKRTKITPESCFKRIGSLKLTLTDRDCNYRNLTRWSSHEESKYIDKECKFSIELKPEQLPYKFGMLHARYLGSDGRPYWTRFFVELYGAQIKFWNSKQDAQDGKKPNEIIEYHDICSEGVQKLTPDDDLYRQNSFVFYTYQQVAGGEKDSLLQRILEDEKRFKLVKHQLAADSKEERDSWCTTLDKSMFCFREWHGKTRIFSMDEVREAFSTNFYNR